MGALFAFVAFRSWRSCFAFYPGFAFCAGRPGFAFQALWTCRASRPGFASDALRTGSACFTFRASGTSWPLFAFGALFAFGSFRVALVQRAIAASILAQRHLTATVTCPATVLQQDGLRFSCTATVAERTYPFEVTETDAAGHVRYVGR